jgi:hypothetical protein
MMKSSCLLEEYVDLLIILYAQLVRGLITLNALSIKNKAALALRNAHSLAPRYHELF